MHHNGSFTLPDTETYTNEAVGMGDQLKFQVPRSVQIVIFGEGEGVVVQTNISEIPE